MEIRLRAMTCGWLTGSLAGFLEGEHGTIKVPVPAYLIEHPRGKIVFDTGMHPDAQRDPAGRLGPAAASVFTVDFRPGEDVAARLAVLGCDPADIRTVINSHLHFDHTGGNALFPNATFLHQRAEWNAGREPDLVESNFFDPHDYDLGQDVRLVDGEHDVFGDGSVVCLPTHGHTPGHQSLHVRLPGGDVVLTADSCYLRRTLEEMRLPPICHDRAAALASLRRLGELRARGARLLFGHDPEAWASVPQAPEDVR
ncbi:MAG TPA: N-acyl homoserine lactonase family protein [Candidatus Binatia bacterium]|nr:N-acyl homoserine lactonase family protein [Candidatus Binatia bacterium]